MAASPARLVAAAMHLLRMQALRQREIDEGVPPHRRLSAIELVERTADPADTLITSLLLSREFLSENADLPESIADRAIRKARKGGASC
jgi:hypothetical protein